MSVTTKHPLYLKYAKRWKRVEDVYDGQDAVKSGGESYLRRTGGQIAAEMAGETDLAAKLYDNYKHKAQLPDIFAPSVVGLVGIACRKKWEIESPPAMKYLWENAGGGIPLDAMQARLINEGLRNGRLGHFVDSDPVDSKLRVALYGAKSIINWKRDYNKTSLVVLHETHETDSADIFSHEHENHYRALRLIPTKNDDGFDTNWQYAVEIYTPESDTYQVTETPEMSFQEQIIPFTFQGSTGLEVDPDVIPLEGMLNHCLKYYELSADLFHDIHQSNTSTAVALGFKKEDLSFAGAGAMIYTDKPPTEADFKFVSTDGKGQQAAMMMMDKQIESAEKQSHRMTEKGAGVEAVNTVRQRAFTKTATLRSVELQAVAALTHDLRFIAQMTGLNPDAVSVESEFDYTDEEVDAQLLTAFSNAASLGTLPHDAAVEYVMANNMYKDRTHDEVLALIEESEEKQAAQAIGLGEPVVEE